MKSSPESCWSPQRGLSVGRRDTRPGASRPSTSSRFRVPATASIDLLLQAGRFLEGGPRLQAVQVGADAREAVVEDAQKTGGREAAVSVKPIMTSAAVNSSPIR
jgi:hypothetical protein